MPGEMRAATADPRSPGDSASRNRRPPGQPRRRAGSRPVSCEPGGFEENAAPTPAPVGRKAGRKPLPLAYPTPDTRKQTKAISRRPTRGRTSMPIALPGNGASWERRVLGTRVSRPHRSAAVLPSHSRAGGPCRAPLRFDRTGFTRANRSRSVKEPWQADGGRTDDGTGEPRVSSPTVGGPAPSPAPRGRAGCTSGRRSTDRRIARPAERSGPCPARSRNPRWPSLGTRPMGSTLAAGSAAARFGESEQPGEEDAGSA